MQEIRDIEVVVDEGITFNIKNNDGVMAPKEMNDNGLGGPGADEAHFMNEITGRLSSVASVVSNSTVSFLLEIMHCSSFDLNDLKQHVRNCNDCRELSDSGVSEAFEKMGLATP